MSQPSRYYVWEQARQKLTVGAGVCYGLCVTLGKKVPHSSDLDETYGSIESILRNPTRILNSGIAKQKSEQQYSRKRLQELPENEAIIICCNTSSSSGWCTRYSIMSYANPFAWFGNHACLLWHNQDGSLIFDPNTGLSLWPKEKDPDYSSVMRMLDWGYHRIGSPRPIYVWGFEALYKGN